MVCYKGHVEKVAPGSCDFINEDTEERYFIHLPDLEYTINDYDKATIVGSWYKDSQQKRYFGVETLQAEIFDSVEGLRRFLRSTVCRYKFKGVNIEKIIDLLSKNGTNPIREMNRLVLGDIDQMVEGLDFTLDIQKVGIFRYVWKNEYINRQFSFMGLTSDEIKSIIKYRDPDLAIEYAQTNPYRLIELDLAVCDKIIKEHPWYFEDPCRKCGQIARFIFQQLFTKHHIYLTEDQLSNAINGFMNHKDDLLRDYPIVFEGQNYGLDFAMNTETTIVKRVIELINKPFEINETLVRMGSKRLSEEQWEAVLLALRNPISIITGCAGSGKTSLISEITRNLTDLHEEGKFRVVSFTGKAMIRIRELTGLTGSVSTIHKLLVGGKNPTIQTLLIDEISMVPSSLFDKLLGVLPMLKRLIMIGDPNQLSTISWGELICPLIEIKDIPHIHLTQNHRIVQGITDAIVPISRELIESDSFELLPRDNVLWFDGGPVEIRKTIVHYKKSGYNGNQITVIAPYNKMVDELNVICQDIFNPNTDKEKIFQNVKWRIGDRIMMCENNYDLNVFNGQEGQIINMTVEGLVCRFDTSVGLFYFHLPDIDVEKEIALVSQLRHSWALTVEKSQGSEWPIVIGSLPKADSNFLTRERFYVMMTRATTAFVLFGSGYVVNNMIDRLTSRGQSLIYQKFQKTSNGISNDQSNIIGTISDINHNDSESDIESIVPSEGDE